MTFITSSVFPSSHPFLYLIFSFCFSFAARLGSTQCKYGQACSLFLVWIIAPGVFRRITSPKSLQWITLWSYLTQNLLLLIFLLFASVSHFLPVLTSLMGTLFQGQRWPLWIDSGVQHVLVLSCCHWGDYPFMPSLESHYTAKWWGCFGIRVLCLQVMTSVFRYRHRAHTSWALVSRSLLGPLFCFSWKRVHSDIPLWKYKRGKK